MPTPSRVPSDPVRCVGMSRNSYVRCIGLNYYLPTSLPVPVTTTAFVPNIDPTVITVLITGYGRTPPLAQPTGKHTARDPQSVSTLTDTVVDATDGRRSIRNASFGCLDAECDHRKNCMGNARPAPSEAMVES